MSNPNDETNEFDNVESPDEVCAENDNALTLGEGEEDISLEEEIKPLKKKALALEARHRIEDYELDKQMREALDYFDDEDTSLKKGSLHGESFIPVRKKKIKKKL